MCTIKNVSIKYEIHVYMYNKSVIGSVLVYAEAYSYMYVYFEYMYMYSVHVPSTAIYMYVER